MEGNIYRIICRKTGKQYIGFTTKKIDSRLYHHEQKYDVFKKTGISRENYSSFEVLEENDYYIELIETITCSSRTELLKVERSHIEKNDCVNKLLPYATDEERKIKDKIWFNNHKKEKQEYDKKYREEKKEKLEETYLCECGSTCLKRQKLRHERTSKHQEFLTTNVVITRKPILKHILNMAVLTDQSAKSENK